MATVTGLTAARMLEIENNSIVNGYVNQLGNLILTTKGGATVDAGRVKGVDATATKTYGTTAERDSYFGAPATDSERASLANAKVMWFNTDTQWLESFYAVTGTPGLTAQGLITGTPPGWYPVGEGPYAKMIASGQQGVVPSTWVTAWNAFGSGGSGRKGGSDWFTYAGGKITCVKPGMYDAHVMSTHQTGTGATVTHLMRDSTSLMRVVNNLNSTYITSALFKQESIAMNAGQSFGYFAEIGSYNLHVANENPEARGIFNVRYKGPLLALN